MNLNAGEATRDRVLVIGCGFLGGHIAAGLARRGFAVSALSRSFGPTISSEYGGVVLMAGDARDRRALSRALADVREVIYCVGGLQPASAERNRSVDAARALGPLKALLALLRCCPEIGITYLSSGGAIYGNPRWLPVDEDHPPAPIGAYAAVRVEGERMLSRAAGHTRILRCANVYGQHQPLDRGQGVVGVFADRIRRGLPIELFGDGSTVRDYIYVGDLVQALAGLLTLPPASLVVNVGSGVGTSLTELIGLVEHAVGRTAIVARQPARRFDVRRVVLDVGRLRNLVEFDPIPISDGVALVAADLNPSDSAITAERVPSA